MYLVTLKEAIASNLSTRYFREVFARVAFADEHRVEMDVPHLCLSGVRLWDEEGSVELPEEGVLRIPMANVLAVETLVDDEE